MIVITRSQNASVRQPARIVLFLTLAIIAGISCTQNNDSGSYDSTMIVQTIGDEKVFFQLYWGMETSHLMFLSLVTYEFDGTRTPRGVLAERWEANEDFTEWTFFLRDNIRWHDGVPTTAHDIAFSIDMMNWNYKRMGLEQRDSVLVIDDNTIKFVYDSPVDAIGLNYWTVYYPKHLLEDKDLETITSWDFWSEPVGNGPYIYERHIDQTMTEIRANPDYYRGKPEIDRIILKYSQGVNIQEYLSGDVDAIIYVNPDAILKLKGRNDYNHYYWWGRWLSTILWNHENPLFEDDKVRRALTLAMDRKALSEALAYPEQVPIVDQPVSAVRKYEAASQYRLRHDLEQARKLLEEAGWQDLNGDGIREKDGQDFTFKVTVTNEYSNQAVVLKDQLREAGVQMDLQVVDISVLREKLRNRDYEALLHRSLISPHHPEMGMIKMLGPESAVNYRDEKIYNWYLELDQLKPVGDEARSDSLYVLIGEQFRQDMPFTFLLPRISSFIAHKKIKGLNNYKPNPLWFAEDLYIDPEWEEDE